SGDDVRRGGRLAMEGNTPQPQAQRMPVDAGDDAEREHRVAEQRAGDRSTLDGREAAAQAGEQQRAAGIIVIDAGDRSLVACDETEAIAALDRAERRDMEDLLGA